MTDRFKLPLVVYLLLRKGNDVLFSRRANTGWQDGKWGFVAGHIDGNERASQALIREAQEEIGITIEPSEVRLVHTAHRLGRNDGQEYIDLFFEVWRWQGEILNLEAEKCSGLQWCSIDNLPADTIVFVRQTVAYVGQGVSYSEYLTEPEA